MKRLEPEIIDYYNQEVVTMIADKYGYSFMDDLREFIFSQMHAMLEAEEHGLSAYGAGAILEMWEAEKITGRHAW
ncbi:MAG: hypothetical protein HDT40_10065 [Lachnospiraceae bacterium]|nr:hypothetical protein [Lachnospiraceae bacterium]